jgi:hypothetical protein
MTKEIQDEINNLSTEISQLGIYVGQIDACIEIGIKPLVEAVEKLITGITFVDEWWDNRDGGTTTLVEAIENLTTAIEDSK